MWLGENLIWKITMSQSESLFEQYELRKRMFQPGAILVAKRGVDAVKVISSIPSSSEVRVEVLRTECEWDLGLTYPETKNYIFRHYTLEQ